ncbi:guanine nucleotide-binding protein G(I)/G(S)/G(O) subunit gamma-10-like [Apostichopus japonicus]
MSSSADISMKKTVEQLRREKEVERMKVSDVAYELQQYCEQHAEADFLLTGIPGASGNPFKEKKSCSIL